MTKRKKKRISDQAVTATIIQMAAAAGADNYIRPEDVAMELYPEAWQTMLKRIRLTARQLAEVGHVVILRKGQPVDPNDFKGVYRIRITDAFFAAPTNGDKENEEASTAEG